MIGLGLGLGLNPAAAVSGGPVPWTPANLAVVPVAWWDAQDEATITLASGSFAAGGPVSAWANKGSAGGSATQGTGAQQPAFSRTGLAAARSALSFSGDSLPFTPSIMPSGANPSATFAMATANTGASGAVLIGWGTQTNQQFRGLTVRPGPVVATSTWGTDLTSAVTFNVPRLVMQSCSTSDGQRLFVDGTQTNSGALASLNSPTTNGAIGSLFGFSWSDQISEILVLGYLPTLDERQRIEGYLAHRWGTNANLPGAHPYFAAAPTV